MPNGPPLMMPVFRTTLGPRNHRSAPSPTLSTAEMLPWFTIVVAAVAAAPLEPTCTPIHLPAIVPVGPLVNAPPPASRTVAPAIVCVLVIDPRLVTEPGAFATATA